MKMNKFKWENVGDRSYLETTTEAMQVCYFENFSYLKSLNGYVGGLGKPWVGEILEDGKWKFVGEFLSKAGVIENTIVAYVKSQGRTINESKNN